MEPMKIGLFEIGGIILGVVELAKQFDLHGKCSLILALCLGLPLFGYAGALEAGLIPEAVAVGVTVAIVAIGRTLAIPGLYGLAKRVVRMPDSNSWG